MLYNVFRLIALLFFRFYSIMQVEGVDQLPKDKAFILAPNHFSNIDVFILLAAVKIEFYTFGKIELFHNPILKWFSIKLNAIPVNRKGFCRHAFMAATKLLQQNKNLAIFPEGQVSKDGRMGGFKLGIAKLALEINVPIIPVAIIGSNRVLPLGHIIPKPHRVFVKFGQPIYMENYEQDYDKKELKEVTERIRNEILNLINSHNPL